MKLLEVSYVVSEENYVSYLLHHNWRSEERIRLRLTIHLLILIAFLGLTSALFVQPLYSWNNIIIVVVGLMLQALIPIFMEYRIANAARKKFRASYPNGFQTTHIEVTEDTLTLIKEAGSTDLWVGKIKDLEEFEKLLIIHTTEFTIMLPQNSFEDKAAYEHFVRTLSEIISKVKNIDIQDDASIDR
jgi:hypothetical protein